MNKRDVTIIIPTSVLPSHPNTHIIEETLKSVRYHFPENEIIIQVDGLRFERQDKKNVYDEFKNVILWKSLHEWENVLPIIFDIHSHQTTMMKKTIKEIKTSAMLYVEADCPIVIDREIAWDECLDMLEYEKANTIRFHFEDFIPKDHLHLVMEQEGNFMKTIQWSQRPHLSLVSYYKNVVLPFSEEKTFIEDRFHGKVQDDVWEDHKLWIYHPSGGIKRSYHLDGREGSRKFTSDDISWGHTE